MPRTSPQHPEIPEARRRGPHSAGALGSRGHSTKPPYVICDLHPGSDSLRMRTDDSGVHLVAMANDNKPANAVYCFQNATVSFGLNTDVLIVKYL